MLHKSHGSIEWLEFELLQGMPLQHGVFLRRGGASTGSFDSLNLSLSSGDDLQCIQHNRRKVRDVFFGDVLWQGSQVHGDHIEIVTDQWRNQTVCDGMITEQKNQPLLILHADCQATIFYDPVHHRLANVHCGWRGNRCNIYANVVQQLQQLGSKPKDLLVCISPSLGPEHAKFDQFETQWPRETWVFRQKNTCFDLWAMSRFQLMQQGVLASHIECANMCTYAQEAKWFSYRRDKTMGRNGTVACLR